MAVAKQTTLTLPEWFLPVWEEFEQVVKKHRGPNVTVKTSKTTYKPKVIKFKKSQVIRYLIWQHVMESRKGGKPLFYHSINDKYVKMYEKARAGNVLELINFNIEWSLRADQSFFYFMHNLRGDGKYIKNLNISEDELEKIPKMTYDEFKSHEIFDMLPIKVEDLNEGVEL